MAMTQFQYVGGATPRQTGEFTIVALDPGLTDDAGRPVTATCAFPTSASSQARGTYPLDCRGSCP